jgi:hypothetical protein
MTTSAAPAGQYGPANSAVEPNRGALPTTRREETKASWKSTELWVYLAAVVGVLIASLAVGDDSGNNTGDIFTADKAWLYITLLTIGYMISRGLAKSGTHTRDNDPRTR